MAAATSVVQVANEPGKEVRQVTADDTDTYVVQTLGSISGVHVSCNTNDDADLNATWSSRTVTINHASQTANVYTLTIYGNP